MSATNTIDPSHSALLVMDYQHGILSRVENGDELIAIARNLIRTFREHGGTIGFVRVAFVDGDFDDVKPTSAMAAGLSPEARAMLHADAPGTQIPDEIAPETGDIVVRKQRPGAFHTTNLEQQLDDRGIDTLVLAGISTSGVVLSTVVEAFERDYRIIVVSDACADPEPETHRFMLEHYFPKRGRVVEVRELHSLLH